MCQFNNKIEFTGAVNAMRSRLIPVGLITLILAIALSKYLLWHITNSGTVYPDWIVDHKELWSILHLSVVVFLLWIYLKATFNKYNLYCGSCRESLVLQSKWKET